MPVQETIYEDNLRLGQLEYQQQHIYLRSRPRFLGLVLGNACNIYCPHCYQSKNGDNLLKPAAIGRELRREFMGLYPYLTTLRIQGGEAMAYAGFGDLIEDVAATATRPMLSMSTNGTLIGEEWAERIVRLPFRNVTVSIDGGTPETYARLRRGADLDAVMANVDRIQRWKRRLGSELPRLDSFFVAMRSNFRELPQYLDLMSQHGFEEVALQTAEINAHNTAREPNLAADESIAGEAEVRELHALIQGLLPEARRRFRSIRISGLTSLFEAWGLDSSFLDEQEQGLYPDSRDLTQAEPAAVPLCPNPWTTMFVAENGGVHLCFLAEPVGNLYEEPLAAVWNSPHALAKRSRMISGRYLAAGCSAHWCSWREGKPAAAPSAAIGALREEMKQLAGRAAASEPLVQIGGAQGEADRGIAQVRRMVASRDRTIRELEAGFVELCETNREIHERGQHYIEDLEAGIADLESGHEKARRRIEDLEASEQKAVADFNSLEREYRRLRGTLPGRIAARLSRLWQA
jgi:MoaA/NifB/PqqE/SkfB family radical SAM enzyme